MPNGLLVDNDVVTRSAPDHFALTGYPDYLTIIGTVTISNITDMKEWKLQCIKLKQDTDSSGLVVGIVPSDSDPFRENGCDPKPLCDIYKYEGVYGVDLNGTGHGYYGVDHHLVPGYGKSIGDTFDRNNKRHTNVNIWGQIKEGDVITILYVRTFGDEHYGKLYFEVNDGEFEEVIKWIPFDEDETYKFAISIPFEGESWELLQ